MLHAAPAIPRLGVPAYNWWNEGLHGVARAGIATVFPQAIGLAPCGIPRACTRWQSPLPTRPAPSTTSTRAKATGACTRAHPLGSQHQYLSRPSLGTRARDLRRMSVPHRAVGGGLLPRFAGRSSSLPEGGGDAQAFRGPQRSRGLRHGFNARSAKRTCANLPARVPCLHHGSQAESIMGAYNRTNGEPCCGSPTLLRRILRENGDFRGYVVSDCWAIQDFHQSHRVTNSFAESAALAVHSGCDLNCGCAYGHIPGLWRPGSCARRISTPACAGCFARACAWVCLIRPSACPTRPLLTR